MAVWTYEDVTPSLIENTTMQKGFSDGVHRVYVITPCEGYVLHDVVLDSYVEYDEEGNGIGEPILGYTPASKRIGANYDFVTNPKEFYAVLASSVPADQIYGGGDDHEVM